MAPVGKSLAQGHTKTLLIQAESVVESNDRHTSLIFSKLVSPLFVCLRTIDLLFVPGNLGW